MTASIFEYLRGIGLVVLGFVLSQAKEWFSRRRRLRNSWSALKAEVDICEHLARTYLQDGVMAPLYRLPTDAFSTSFPVLLAEGAIKGDEVKDLESFFGWIQDINRGLDNANVAMHSGNNNQLRREYDRLHLKAKELLDGRQGVEPYLTRGRRVLARHLL